MKMSSKFKPLVVCSLISDRLGLTFWVVAYVRFDCINYELSG